MSHQIETHNNEAAAVFARQSAWHRLGTTLDDAFTAEQAMEVGHLGGWEVRKAPLHLDSGLVVPDRFATVRTNPFTGETDYLGVVGTQYHPIQNEEHADFLNALVDEAGAHFETAGSLNSGRQVFLTLKLPDQFLVGGVDPIDQYLAAVNSHDGTSSFRLMVTPIRVVCANTLRVALGNTSTGITSVRHTVNARAAGTEARRSLDLSFKYLDSFQAEADAMIQQTLTDGQFMDIMTEAFGVDSDASPRAKTNATNLLEQFQTLFMDADTQQGIRNTRWAAYQTVTEYADHYADVRASDGADLVSVRAQRVLLGGMDDLKSKAFSLFRVNA